MNKKQFIGIVLLEISIFLVLVYTNVSIPCIFKKVLSIPCPGCGLTRAYRAFFHGQFLEAFSYNILFIPSLALIAWIHYVLIQNVFYQKKLTLFQTKYLWVFGILLFLSEIYNLIMGL